MDLLRTHQMSRMHLNQLSERSIAQNLGIASVYQPLENSFFLTLSSRETAHPHIWKAAFQPLLLSNLPRLLCCSILSKTAIMLHICYGCKLDFSTLLTPNSEIAYLVKDSQTLHRFTDDRILICIAGYNKALENVLEDLNATLNTSRSIQACVSGASV